MLTLVVRGVAPDLLLRRHLGLQEVGDAQQPRPHTQPHLGKDVPRVLESDQTQLLVEVPAISYFSIPTDGKGVPVWFHFLLAAGKLLTGDS